MRHFIFLFCLFFYSDAFAQGNTWLLVDTQRKVIQVKQDQRTLATFEKISLGRGGAHFKQRAGDDITPIGSYRIAYMNNKSHFRVFFGLNYPSVNDAGLALYSERISYTEYQTIMQAHRMNLVPPQDTVLGGQIGIHGVGSGNQKVHGLFDWTHGCIAISNRQIDKLAKWVYQGMRVEIK